MENKKSKIIQIEENSSSGPTKVLVAIHDYQAQETTEISFKKGDHMKFVDDKESDRWRVIHLTTKQEGLIPRNYVAEEKSLNSEE